MFDQFRNWPKRNMDWSQGQEHPFACGFHNLELLRSANIMRGITVAETWKREWKGKKGTEDRKERVTKSWASWRHNAERLLLGCIKNKFWTVAWIFRCSARSRCSLFQESERRPQFMINVLSRVEGMRRGADHVNGLIVGGLWERGYVFLNVFSHFFLTVGLFLANFERPVLCCIDANFRK